MQSRDEIEDPAGAIADRMVERIRENALVIGPKRLEPQAQLAGNRLHRRIGQRLDQEGLAGAGDGAKDGEEPMLGAGGERNLARRDVNSGPAQP